MAAIVTERTVLDVAALGTRAVNSVLLGSDAPAAATLANPRGAHALACGLNRDTDIVVDGNVGYYCAGMNQHANVTINGSAGVGVAENMMSGTVRVHGDASQSAGATAHGGLLVIDGNAGARCGISMKGVDIVVGGNIGHMSAFMGQAGRLVVLGDAGEALGDSLYEARIYVRGTVASLGADCVRKPLREEHVAELRELLSAAGFEADPTEFNRYGSARQLYHFHVDNAGAY
ncbi:protein glxC [Nocardia pneumoniae]|uniref:GltB/FmdC/FwdC-like GXGXG domain-containing protein n=1 Tax=Nocardia pneumoniae TaxID=228601 RepID=UPI000311A16C|nr:protein glxC [Nocardia pneumoniae]